LIIGIVNDEEANTSDEEANTVDEEFVGI